MDEKSSPNQSDGKSARSMPDDQRREFRAQVQGLDGKVPKSVVFGDLPKTSTGKVQKFVLRERARGI